MFVQVGLDCIVESWTNGVNGERIFGSTSRCNVYNSVIPDTEVKKHKDARFVVELKVPEHYRVKRFGMDKIAFVPSREGPIFKISYELQVGIMHKKAKELKTTCIPITILSKLPPQANQNQLLDS